MRNKKYQNVEMDLLREVESEGFFVLKNFLNRDEVEELREELVNILENDLNYRNNNITTSVVNYDGKISSLTEHLHDYLFAVFHSQRFAKLVNKILEHELIKNFTDIAIGKNFRLRVDLFRRASGVNDCVDNFDLPHKWHRDSPGEFTFGFFLDDMNERGSGCTAVIPKSHRSNYSPLWDLMFSHKNNLTGYKDFLLNGMNYKYLPNFLNKLGILNWFLRKCISKEVKTLSGRMGDIFFFFNDIWHGREPNMTGKQFMLVRIGGFASGFKFKDDLPLPSPKFELPPLLTKRYSENQVLEIPEPTLMQQINTNRKDRLLVHAAVYEKRILRLISLTLNVLKNMFFVKNTKLTG